MTARNKRDFVVFNLLNAHCITDNFHLSFVAQVEYALQDAGLEFKEDEK